MIVLVFSAHCGLAIRFKAKLWQKGTFSSLEDARTKVFEYIETYYNPIGRHSALGYLSPKDFEQLFYQLNNQNLS